jgi:predicted nuclease of predicted toxin-antitoxin system
VIRFLADACLAHYIVSGCLRREPAMDFKSAVSAKSQGKTDLEILTLADQEGRVFVTQDVRTMPRHFATFLQQNNHSPGVILIPQAVPTAAAIDALILIWAATEPEEWANRIFKLPLQP